MITSDPDDALLVVRLGCAANALTSQHRFAAAATKAEGVAAARDLSAAMVVAAGLTKEALKLLVKNQERVRDLANAAGASQELMTEFQRLIAGTHPASALLSMIRNKVGFHFDPQVLRDALDELSEHESVIWVEAGQRTAGEQVLRISTDAILTAIVPEPPDVKHLSPEERVRAGQERARDALTVIGDAMTAVDQIIQHAVGGFLLAHHVQLTHADDARDTSTSPASTA